MHVELLETFITGHPKIDEEHRQIVDMINAVSDSINTGEHQRCAVLLDKFIELCSNHFMSEEALLADLEYPELTNHAVFHGELLLKAKAIKALCVHAKDKDHLKRCFDEMATLLIEDVVRGDMQFVSFLEDQGIVAPSPNLKT